MNILKTFAVAALFLTATNAAEAKYGGGGSGQPPGAGAIASGVTAMTGRMGDERVLMDARMMSLYTFDKDGAGTSTCYDSCAADWPPLLAPAGTGLAPGYSLIQRSDATWQVAYRNQPLYLWAGDARPGQMSGDGIGGVWHVARP